MDRDRLSTALDRLSDKDRFLVAHRFGFDGAPVVSVRQLGEQLGISPQRCRRLVARALGRLNAELRASGLSPHALAEPIAMEGSHVRA